MPFKCSVAIPTILAGDLGEGEMEILMSCHHERVPSYFVTWGTGGIKLKSSKVGMHKYPNYFNRLSQHIPQKQNRGVVFQKVEVVCGTTVACNVSGGICGKLGKVLCG